MWFQAQSCIRMSCCLLTKIRLGRSADVAGNDVTAGWGCDLVAWRNEHVFAFSYKPRLLSDIAWCVTLSGAPLSLSLALSFHSGGLWSPVGLPTPVVSLFSDCDGCV